MKLRVAHLFDGREVTRDVVVRLTPDGVVDGLEPYTPESAVDAELPGLTLPGVPNVHSHAFQRALVGRTEVRGANAGDSFWTWREVMYAEAAALSPERLLTLATRLYRECLAAGYTHVGEFHYVHHQADGAPYAAPATMAEALVEAAARAGIGLTWLPVAYLTGGFDTPLAPRQQRFASRGVDDFLRLMDDTRRVARGGAERVPGGVQVGVAPHSLRAVPLGALAALLDGVGPETRVHIHVSEQRAEVEQCLAKHGRRPIQLLADRGWLSPRWCLVHATHADADERRAMATSGAVAGLCPTTEANLGDGLFAADDYLDLDGALALGSDSHATVAVAEELRWLEYGQRLRREARNVLATRATPRVAETLLGRVVVGGRRAVGLPEGRRDACFAPGTRFDAVVLDLEHTRFAELPVAQVPDAWVFGSAEAAVRETWVAGQRVWVRGAAG